MKHIYREKIMDKEIIKLAQEKKFSEFSDAIKSELSAKLSANDVVSNYVAEIDNAEQMKAAFANLTSEE